MIKRKRILGIIPARSGSKGLPGKNTINFCGKPLLVWTLESALSSKYIDEIVLTSDSDEILNYANLNTRICQIKRPDILSNDTATTIDVVLHSYLEVKKQNKQDYDFIIVLEPTSPLREVSDIDKSIELLVNHPTAKSLVSFCKSENQHPAFLFRKLDQSILSPYLMREFKVLRRQELEELFFVEGTIYISETSKLMEERTFYHEYCIGYEVPKWKSIEIDDFTDLVIAEALMLAKEKL